MLKLQRGAIHAAAKTEENNIEGLTVTKAFKSDNTVSNKQQMPQQQGSHQHICCIIRTGKPPSEDNAYTSDHTDRPSHKDSHSHRRQTSRNTTLDLKGEEAEAVHAQHLCVHNLQRRLPLNGIL
jgi:hypothetical protein